MTNSSSLDCTSTADIASEKPMSLRMVGTVGMDGRPDRPAGVSETSPSVTALRLLGCGPLAEAVLARLSKSGPTTEPPTKEPLGEPAGETIHDIDEPGLCKMAVTASGSASNPDSDELSLQNDSDEQLSLSSVTTRIEVIKGRLLSSESDSSDES